MSVVLVVDDEPLQRNILNTILSEEGYETHIASSGEEALKIIRTYNPDVVLTDLKMEGMDGIELMESVRSEADAPEVVLMTAFGTVSTAVEAMKKGAFDYLAKPLERDDLLLTLRRAMEHVNLLRENRMLQKRLEEARSIPNIIGVHPKMKEVFRIINKISATSSTVLIYGESGTGKELVARAIHEGSPRKDSPFFAINCAAIPDSLMESELFGHEKGSFTGADKRELGIFEAANGGTVFLDEIGELNTAMQAKLLRAIQEKEIRRVGGKINIPIDVRIISATNKDLEQEIRKGSFREDLFYRLDVIRINLPPLRERGNDIATLAEFFISKYGSQSAVPVKGISKPALKLIMNYPWPGNVRQLESIIERSVLMTESEYIQPEDLPLEIQRETSPGTSLPFPFPPGGISFEELEKDLIIKAMDRADWVIGKAAPLLGMTYKTLQYRLEKFGIEKPEKRTNG